MLGMRTKTEKHPVLGMECRQRRGSIRSWEGNAGKDGAGNAHLECPENGSSPSHVPLHRGHKLLPLDRQPSGVVHDALADEAHNLFISPVVVQCNESWRFLSCLANGVQPAKALRLQILSCIQPRLEVKSRDQKSHAGEQGMSFYQR